MGLTSNLILKFLPSRLPLRLASLDPGRQGLARVYIKPMRRWVYFRPKTTDLTCLADVLLNGEYGIPFRATPKIIIDGGANIGAASLYFSHVYPQAMIYALEPEPSNFAMLKRNCDGVKNILPLQLALWSESARLRFDDPHSEKWAFSVSSGDGTKGSQVEAVGLNDLMRQYGMDCVDILKLDIEGAEREVFSANRAWLDKVKIIAIELHDRFKEGCAAAFYDALHGVAFRQEMRGGSIFIELKRGCGGKSHVRGE